MICPICLNYQIRRTWADFLVVKKICLKCQNTLNLKYDVKEILLYQSSLHYIYLNPIEPAHEVMLFSKMIQNQNVYHVSHKILNFSKEEYLGLTLNRNALIVFHEFITLDDLEMLEHFQALNIIEIRNPDVL